ncbi:uncharacterized protein LOC132740864 isoform X1 [Ruditapes philippinarum]|uniref:uncharacterized protein LOC132740864 isoform X1 n=1 Tax=Ruditapes philippinarum TaxID=129788 RepID=UPI00295B64D5|nr:uncharacterized protein LOC132740864 isoform X1 [Ruditapes philippinarum]
MSYIRKSFESRELSEKSVEIIMASWRRSTKKQYSCYINKWVLFCRERQSNIFQTSIDFVIEFLTELFNKGYSYETLNSARSALSMLCESHEGYNVGSHPLVVRYMTGVYNLRPTRSKYTETWDVSKLLSHLKTLPPVNNLTLKMLSYKLATLIVLTQASRSHSVSLLTLEGMKKDENSFILYYCGLLKQCRKGKRNPVVNCKKYTPDRRLCVYSTLEEYISRTKHLRGEEKRLFISYIKPYKFVVSTTISRWIKCVMRDAGIDVDKYKTHSARGAVTSKAKQSGVPLNEIMKVAGWATERTFAQFYEKPLETEVSFQSAVLQ